HTRLSRDWSSDVCSSDLPFDARSAFAENVAVADADCVGASPFNDPAAGMVMEKDNGLMLAVPRVCQGKLNRKIKLEMGTGSIRMAHSLDPIDMLCIGKSDAGFE